MANGHQDPWRVVSASGPGVFDGIGDFAWHLTEALRAHGPAELVVRRESWRELEAIDPAATAGVIVQYYPQAFLRGDFRYIRRWLCRVRAAGRPVIVTIHEFWPPLDGSLRRAMAQLLFKRVLRSLVRVSTMAVVTRPSGTDDLARAVRTSRVTVIPVGAAVLPDSEPVRKGPGIKLVMFGQPAAMHGDTLCAVSGWMARTAGASLEWFSGSADDMRRTWRETLRLPEDQVTCSGGLAAAEVSRRLRAAHIAIAPNVNGASTRRSTMSALLAHGLPIVALDGLTTSDELRRSGACVWAREGEPEAFVSALEALAADPARQAALGARATRFFDERLSWPVIAAAYVKLLLPGSAAGATPNLSRTTPPTTGGAKTGELNSSGSRR